MSSFPVLSTLCPFDSDTPGAPATDTLYPPVKETPMTPEEFEKKVHQVDQESQNIPPPLFLGYTPNPEPVDVIQLDEFEDKLRRMRKEQQAIPEVPKTHVIQHGDELFATPAMSGTPVLHTKGGARVFTGIFASEEPFRRAVDHDHPYEGVQTYTVNGITFTVDFRKYHGHVMRS